MTRQTRIAPDTASNQLDRARNLPVLSVRNLQTHFELDEGTVRAVDGVSYDVLPGQIVGIVGESGCGKSITMKSILNMVQRPGRVVGGEILYRSQKDSASGEPTETIDIAKLDPKSLQMRMIRGGEIALIPQEPMSAFSPLYTIGNQIMEAIMLHQKVTKADARRKAIAKLRDVGVPDPETRIDSYSWQLSGGLRQRAVIAMALSCNPAILIADEPTTAIDVTTQANILRLLRRLRDEHNTSIVFITHDLGVIAQLADYVVVMYLGKVVEAGPVDNIYHAPKHPYTKALLKSIPNVNSTPRLALPTITGSVPNPFYRPRGCPFHPRCPDVIEGSCAEAIPALYPRDAEQPVSCFLYHDQQEST